MRRIVIEDFLEKSIVNKSNLVILLFKKPNVPLIEVKKKTKLSISEIKKYCLELNDMFKNELIISMENKMISCQFTNFYEEFYLFSIYRQSKVLQFLKFLIVNPSGQKSLNNFAREQYISVSAAYRLREKIMMLLDQLGLVLSKNKIMGPEYRIRYFIALLQAKFGIEIYPLSSRDEIVIREFLFFSSSNLRPSNILSKSFSFFNILLALSWKRYDEKVVIPKSEILTSLHDLFIYDIIKDCSKNIIESRFQIHLSKNDFSYLYCIYLTASNSFASQQWSSDHVNHLLTIFESTPSLQYLFQSISKMLSLPSSSYTSLHKIIVFFARYFILDLQQFIPEKSVFLLDTYSGNPTILKNLEIAVTEWLKQINSSNMNKYYFFLFCNHIEQLIRNHLSPTTVVLITTDCISEQLLSDCISQFLPSKTISYSYFLLRDNIYEISELNPDLVITHQRLISFIKEELAKNSLVLALDYTNIHLHLKKIQEIILDIEEKKYLEYINKQFKFKGENNDL